MTRTTKSIREMGFDSLTNQFHDSLSFNKNKRDYNELDLGSPISPLMTRSSINTAATSSSSSGSSGSVSGKTNSTQLGKRSDFKPSNHSGELSGLSETSPIVSDSHRSATSGLNLKPGHRRSVSAGAPLIYSGKSLTSTINGGIVNRDQNSVSSNPSSNLLTNGNICPSGKVSKAGIAHRTANRTDVLGLGTRNYGHGSIVRGGGAKLAGSDGNVCGHVQSGSENLLVKRATVSCDPEEVKNAGNEFYRRRNFTEALSMYDRAISISPDNAAYRSNRAAALSALGRLWEAVRECEEAVRLDPGYVRAHHRLASLYIRLGLVENARNHVLLSGQESDQTGMQKLKSLEKHLNQCADGRKIGDWKSALRECDAAMAMGADSSPQLIACKAEAFLRLHQLEDAESSLSNISELENYPPSCSQAKFFGMLAEIYVLYVRAQVEMALGRFQNAVVVAEKASKFDYNNVEVAKVFNNVKMVARARSRGNDLFSSGRYEEACSAYGEGLKYDSSNSILYCNRAVCWSKLGLWEKSVEDCNQALKILPNYTKALSRRAASNAKLERWAEAVRDLEVLRRELPGDNTVTESLHRAHFALEKSRGEGLQRTEVGREVEEVSSLDKFKSAISFPGVSVVHFKVASADPCEEVSLFVNTLCIRYPSVKFLKVNVEESLAVAKAESIRTIPTFKIYKNGEKLFEMFRPSHKLLEDSVRNCIL